MYVKVVETISTFEGLLLRFHIFHSNWKRLQMDNSCVLPTRLCFPGLGPFKCTAWIWLTSATPGRMSCQKLGIKSKKSLQEITSDSSKLEHHIVWSGKFFLLEAKTAKAMILASRHSNCCHSHQIQSIRFQICGHLWDIPMVISAGRLAQNIQPPLQEVYPYLNLSPIASWTAWKCTTGYSTGFAR